MSASNSHQILETMEPVRGVKHVKPPIKPKPVLPQRPKEIAASGAENKSPLLSPTCGPCSPTSDIPSALKISQLTGPQPYGTRRTSLKRWSSSVGEDVSGENNALSPLENKITAPPLSAPVRPPPTGPAWKGKSPFMLTTRGWGEQRSTQSRDHNESESASQKASARSVSEDIDTQERGRTTNKEDSRNASKLTPEVEEAVTHVHDYIASPGDVKVVSSGSAQIIDYKKPLSAPQQSHPYGEDSKHALHDHKEDLMATSIGSKPEKKAPKVPIRESTDVPKSETEEQNVKNANVYDTQIGEFGSGPGHVLRNNDIIVDQRHLENTDKNHQPEAHVDAPDPQHIADVTPKKFLHPPDTAYGQPTQHRDEPKDKHVTSKPLAPKPKERKKPSVQFTVPNVEDKEDGQRPLDQTVPEREERETKEYGHKEDVDVRRWDREDGVVEKEEKPEPSVGIEEPPSLVRTQTSSYTMTAGEGISRVDTDVHGPDSHPKDITLHSSPHTTELYEKAECDTKQAEDKDHDHRDVYKRRPEVEPAGKNRDYVPHFTCTPTDSPAAPRSEHDIDAYPAQDLGTSYIHHYGSTADQSQFPENTDRKEPPHMTTESQPADKLPSWEISTHLEELHPSRAPSQPQEELTQGNYQPKTSMSGPGYLKDLTSSKYEEFHSSNFDNTAYRVIQPMESSDGSDHKDGIQYYNTYSQDGEKPKHVADESEESHPSHGHQEEAMYGHAQSEEPVDTYVQSEEPPQTFSQSEEESHKYTALKKPKYEPEKIAHTYQQLEEPDHHNIQSDEESHGDVVLKRAIYEWDQPEKLHQKYQLPEEPGHPNIPSEEESHGDVVLQKTRYGYDKEVKLAHTYQDQDEEDQPDILSQEDSHGDVMLKKSRYGYDEQVKFAYTYPHQEEEDHPNIPSDEEGHKDVVLKKARYGYDEQVKLAHTHHQLEQPDDPNIQSDEESPEWAVLEKARHGYDESEKLAHSYQQSEEPDQPNIPSQEDSHGDVALKRSRNGCDEQVKLAHTYQHQEKPDYPNIQPDEESHKDVVLKKARYGYDEHVKLAYTYQQPEEPDIMKSENTCDQPEKIHHTYEQPELVHHNIKSEDLAHRYELSRTPTLTYDQSEITDYTYDHLKKSYPQETEPTRPEKLYENQEETLVRYSQPEDPQERIIPHVQSDESYYQQTPPQEAASGNYLSEQIAPSESPSGQPHYQQTQSEDPDYQQNQSKRPNYQQTQIDEPEYQQEQSKRPNYQQSQSEEPGYQQDKSHNQQEHSEETPYHHKLPEELHYTQAKSEDLDFRHTHPENLEHQDKSSEQSHTGRYHSEEEVQTPEGKPRMSEQNRVRLEQGYMDFHGVESETSAEQEKAEKRPEMYLKQHQRHGSPEDYHHKDDSTSETYHKDQLSKEQDLKYAQQEQPNTLDTQTVEPKTRDVQPEQQEQKDVNVTDGQSENSQEDRAEDRLHKQIYTEKTINGHCEREESEDGEERLDGQKLSDQKNEESPGEMESDTEETPEEANFDFLEGTTVLDTSLMRGRASLGKKRNHRTPVAGSSTPEEADPEYWMFRDSTEPKCSPEKESEEEEKEETSPEGTPENSPTAPKSTTKKGGIFSGIISPSILKGRRKSKNKTSEDASKAESRESQDPTSPGKDKSESSSHSLNWLQALKKKKKKNPK
ncbi:182 kDa tankyrase-1-binding protein [Dendropsophus ebraccatus]|uniref:182 kDa tankyrase-1-binding protein n=1 Tax=Dendropsophus ebraccatus TaxID=150705 RepID=UPI003831899F